MTSNLIQIADCILFIYFFDFRRNAVQNLYVLITMIDFAVCVGRKWTRISPDTQRGKELTLQQSFSYCSKVYATFPSAISRNLQCLYNEFLSNRHRRGWYLICCESSGGARAAGSTKKQVHGVSRMTSRRSCQQFI